MLTRPVLALLVLASAVSGACVAIEDLGTDEASALSYDFPACITASGTPDPAELEDDTGVASAGVDGEGCHRTFTLASTAERVDNMPAGPRTLVEGDARSVSGVFGTPSLQTTNPLFDALFQLAFAEAKENAVDAIRDWAFNDGAPIRCPAGGCFETGRKWNYVWTRDTSYASDLGLGWVDPQRASSSLSFKLSGRRDDPSAVEIVQDTGSGGSWPVSTDRAVWALGARTILDRLVGSERARFRDLALLATRNTALHDREVVFDPRDGLYRGEQSFLDWRAQTYPSWTVPDTAHIAMSKSLSTNLTHLALLDLVAALSAETGDSPTASTMKGWATSLRQAIRRGFWLADEGLLATYRTTELDPSPVRRFDLLGTSLAVLLDATSVEEARSVIAHYPTLPKGPPVVFPEQQRTAIYHNRAIWPFVTAYWAKAARKVENDAAFTVAIRSLVRGAALNLSNMENLEVETGRPRVADGPYSGPVVNSQRQLWSVAAYIGAITDGLFGVEVSARGTRVVPFIPREIHRALFPGARSIVLNDLSLRGKRLTVVVRLPELSTVERGGAYRVRSIRFDGTSRAPEDFIADRELGGRNLFEVDLESETKPAASVRTIAAQGDHRRLYAPETPSITLDTSGARPAVRIDLGGEDPSSVVWSVLRDGERVASKLSGHDVVWTDQVPRDDRTHCWSVETTYTASGTTSHHAAPTCDWGRSSERISTVWASDFEVAGGRLVDAYGRRFYEEWGDPDDELTATFLARQSGPHLVQAIYGNGAGGLDTGITCAIKHVTVEELPSRTRVGEGHLVMPQRGSWASWGDSSFVPAPLIAGRTYRVRLAQNARSVNMSAFDHFASYTGGAGGRSGAFFRVNIAELKLLALGR